MTSISAPTRVDTYMMAGDSKIFKKLGATQMSVGGEVGET